MIRNEVEIIVGEHPAEPDKLRKIRVGLQEELGEQKIDVVYECRGALSPFGRLAANEGALL